MTISFTISSVLSEGSSWALSSINELSATDLRIGKIVCGSSMIVGGAYAVARSGVINRARSYLSTSYSDEEQVRPQASSASLAAQVSVASIGAAAITAGVYLVYQGAVEVLYPIVDPEPSPVVPPKVDRDRDVDDLFFADKYRLSCEETLDSTLSEIGGQARELVDRWGGSERFCKLPSVKGLPQQISCLGSDCLNSLKINKYGTSIWEISGTDDNGQDFDVGERVVDSQPYVSIIREIPKKVQSLYGQTEVITSYFAD